MPVQLKKGWHNSTTATVAELVAHLLTLPQDVPIAFLWESQITPVVLEEIELSDNDKLASYIVTPIVLVNAET